MPARQTLALLVLAAGAAAAACHAPPREAPVAAAAAAAAPASSAPAATTTLGGAADSQYVRIRARLDALHYRIDEADPRARRLVVRSPGDETRVEVRVTGGGEGAAGGDSSGVSVTPVDAHDLVSGMRVLLTVTHDATMEPAAATGAGGGAASADGELPPSHWRPAFFVGPTGELWIARSGLFATDSLMGRWRRAFGGPADPVGPDELVIGSCLGMVGRDTLLLGLRTPTTDRKGPLAYRSTDGGATWTAVPMPEVTSVDVVEAAGPSVWMFATYFEGEARRAMLLRSGDGGASWDRPPLPPKMNDVEHAYRVTPSVGYAATAGFNKGPVFWRTDDGGDHWSPLPTPRDQRVNEVPSYGSRVEEIATVGPWLVVREYGKVFVSRADTIRWRPLAGVEHVAADRVRDRLFALTTALEPEMLDRDLSVVWKSSARIPDTPRSSDVDGVAAHDGAGYVVMGHGQIYEARDGVLRVRRPR